MFRASTCSFTKLPLTFYGNKHTLNSSYQNKYTFFHDLKKSKLLHIPGKADTGTWSDEIIWM